MRPKKVTSSALIFAVISLFSSFILLRPPAIPGAKDILQDAEVLTLDGAVGPESLAFDSDGGGPYVGVADGRILKWQGEGRGWTDFAWTAPERKQCVHPSAPQLEHVCGRPLGLRFHSKTGDLYIADAYLGLHKVGPNGGLATPVVTEFENQLLRFTNDMDIDEEENVIYFTDTSTVYQRRQFIAAILSLDLTGRLMKYDLSTKQVTVLMKGLAFANGVALSKDRTFVLVAETTFGTIQRYWLKGQKAGRSDVFAELPGFPDNIRRNPKGEFWVALHSKKGIASNWALKNPGVGRFLLKTPLSFKQLHFLMVGGKAYATVIKLNEEGHIVEVLEDNDGKTMRFISEAEEKDGKLWMGSVLTPFLGYLKLT